MLWTEPFSFVRGRGRGQLPGPRGPSRIEPRRDLPRALRSFRDCHCITGRGVDLRQLLVLLTPSEDGKLPGSVWLLHTLDSEVRG